MKTKKRVKQLETVVSGIEAQLASPIRGMREADEASDTQIWLEQPFRVTADQAKSMSDAGGWIMAQDMENGWLFIGNLEADWNEEGNGCWHDEKGDEVHNG